jgi:hypothetical protein
MRLAWRLALREVRRRPGRTALVVLLVAVTVAGITVGDLAYRSRELPAPTDFGRAEVKARVALNGQTDSTSNSTSNLTPRMIAALRAAVPIGSKGVLSWEATLPVQRADQLGLGMEVNLETADLTSPLLAGAVQLRAGRLATAADEVTIGSLVADRLQVTVGSTLTLVMPQRTLRVVGIADHPSGDRALFAAPGYPVGDLQFGIANPVMFIDRVPDDVVASNDINLSTVLTTAPADGSVQMGVYFEQRPVGRPSTAVELLILWLVSVLVLGVLAIVVAAAFAASGRRQLVTLGQLGAVGADPSFARRFLGLQGVVTAGLGAVIGVGVGAVVCAIVGDPLLRHGLWNPVAFDIVVVVLTTVVAGTFAALVPTRALASAPVLSALAGRAPVKAVRAQQVRVGMVGIALGLVVLGLSVGAARTSGAGTSLATAMALVSAGAVLGGMCAVCPALVDRGSLIGRRSHGSMRLAVRSMIRHRARSAALVAAIAAVGAAGVAGASGIERWSQLDQRTTYVARLDVITVMPSTFYASSCCADAGGGVVSPPPATATSIDPDVVRNVEAVVPGIHWQQARTVTDGSMSMVVADDASLTALGVPKSQWDAVRHLNLTKFGGLLRSPAYGVNPGYNAVVPELKVPTVQLLSPTAASSPEWRDAGPMLIGTAPSPLTGDQRARLNVATFPNRYAGVFRHSGASAQAPPLVQFEYPFRGPAVTRTEARWLLIAGLLLLVTIIISMGLALWAAEGKVERDQLVAVGAKPRSLALMAQARAWVITTTGGLIAVPLGWGMLQVVLHASNTRSPFPWITASMVAVGLPLLVAIGAFAASTAGQRLRPADGSTMSVD